MSAWLLGSIVLLLGGLVPAGWMAARGTAVDRLVGLEMGGTVTALELMLFSQAEGEPQYLIVPLVLALLSLAGTLVYTRLLAPRS
ncbi:MAG TPA: monovalent cation/H+ antiporter complex subunit F [Trebonia sp.]